MIGRRQFIGGEPVEIASAVVRALPGRAAALRAQLAAMPGVEVHAETEDGRFIVTVEGTAGASAGDTLLALHRIEDVLAAALVSHYEA
jgi:nitrate reductase NapD